MSKVLRISVPLCLLSFLLLSGCAYINIDLASLMQIQPYEERVISKGGSEKVLVLEILGPITTTAMRDTIRPKQGTLERIESILEKAEKDKNITGLILRIDSPGGGYTASDLTFRRIVEYREKHELPVVACITNQGTSGAYMVALSADQIVALPSSVVGNVGVLLPSISLEGLLDKLGIRNQTLTSGKFKDTGNPLRDMTDDDRQILEAIVMEFQQNFIERLKERRPVTEQDLAVIEDGRVMTASAGLKVHLIDQVGYYEEALEAMESLSQVSDPTVVVYRRKGENAGGFYSWP
ncbi:MAG TPA: signal peptide peptidase SppA [Deltaproteobacteria bacterium]|nr:signal peptide peptidase SppA [Deltaproteobacteria bacterium]